MTEEIQNVESQPEPVKTEPLAAIPSVPEKPEIIEEEETMSHRKRIVVVEDDEEIRNYLRDELSANYHVVTCANGKEALSERENQDEHQCEFRARCLVDGQDARRR